MLGDGANSHITKHHRRHRIRYCTPQNRHTISTGSSVLDYESECWRRSKQCLLEALRGAVVESAQQYSVDRVMIQSIELALKRGNYKIVSHDERPYYAEQCRVILS